MNDLFHTLLQKKKLLDSFRPLPPALLNNLEEWFRIELTYNSNAIEGNTLTRSETAMVVEKGLTIGGKPLVDHLEAINLAHAIDYVKTLVSLKKTDITLQTILDIHSIVLRGIRPEDAGKWRRVDMRISGSTVQLAEPLKVLELIEEFIQWLGATHEDIISVAADAHLKFVIIHPFVDGNGRTARLLMNLILMQAGYPPAIIEQEKRAPYISAIEKAHLTHETNDFHQFIYKAVEKSLDIYIDAAQKTI